MKNIRSCKKSAGSRVYLIPTSCIVRLMDKLNPIGSEKEIGNHIRLGIYKSPKIITMYLWRIRSISLTLSWSMDVIIRAFSSVIPRFLRDSLVWPMLCPLAEMRRFGLTSSLIETASRWMKSLRSL